MKKNKYIYTLSALMMACIISFSGVGGSYIQARASNSVLDSLWNHDVDPWENIKRHIRIWSNSLGVFFDPVNTVLNFTDFIEFMCSDGNMSKQSSHDALCGCGNTYTSCPAFISDGDYPTFDISLFVDGGDIENQQGNSETLNYATGGVGGKNVYYSCGGQVTVSYGGGGGGAGVLTSTSSVRYVNGGDGGSGSTGASDDSYVRIYKIG